MTEPGCIATHRRKQDKGGATKVVHALSFSLLLFAPVHIGAEEFPREARANGGMVAAASPLAAEAGLRMLEQGGNAVDAAAATAFALSVVEPFGSGLGGDGVALIYLAATDEVVAFEYRAMAPMGATPAVYDYSEREQWRTTGLGPGVPGMVAGTCMMHEEFGLLSLAEVMQPAIEAAENGFRVGPTLSRVITDYYDLLIRDEASAEIYLIDDFPPEVGDTLYNRPLAATLRTLVEKGPEEFYRGEMAERIVGGLQAAGGVHTLEDFARYEPSRSTSLSIRYRDKWTIHSAPLPFGGIGVLMNLQYFQRLPFDAEAGPRDPRNLHSLAEAMKLGSKDRYATSGDPRFVRVPVDLILSDAFADWRASQVNPERATPRTELVDADYSMELEVPGNTTHFTVADAQGNAVAITQTLGGFFGSGVMAGDTGIVMNDQMKNFSRLRFSPNNPQPGKRMHSTQAPTIVTADDSEGFVLAVGSPGNYRIITTVTQMVVNVLDYGMDLPDAVNEPRISAGSAFTALEVEGGFDTKTVEALRDLGHPVNRRRNFDLFFGGVHGVLRDPETGMLTGAADPRRDGIAVGIALPTEPNTP